MRLGELARASGGPLPQGTPDLDIVGLSANSRTVRPGFLFAALHGSHTDGAGYLEDALARGASAALVSSESVERARRLGIPVVSARDPRRRLARMAAAFHGVQPGTVVAVTGTNGKTSIAHFLVSMWRRRGFEAAMIGTLGIHSSHGPSRKEGSASLTTPDPISLHAELAALARTGVNRAVIEASSHGLDQRRLDGVEIAVGLLSSIDRDHLDYHGTEANYRAAKRRLFSHLVGEGGAAVLNADAPGASAFRRAAEKRSLRVVSFARKNRADWFFADNHLDSNGQVLVLDTPAGAFDVRLPLIGDFQMENAVAAAAAASLTGLETAEAVKSLETLTAPPGRLERVATHRGATVYIDYAHTPAALAAVCAALRPHVEGKLFLVFGCGGERDPGKRVLMGRIASRGADSITVTDDNPRGEDPAAIRAVVLASCPEAKEIGDREEAIRDVLGRLSSGDALLVAGKGHETVQIRAGETLPFDDRSVVQALAEEAS